MKPLSAFFLYLILTLTSSKCLLHALSPRTTDECYACLSVHHHSPDFCIPFCQNSNSSATPLPSPGSLCTRSKTCEGDMFCLDASQPDIAKPCAEYSKNCFCFDNLNQTPCNNSYDCGNLLEGCLQYGEDGGCFCATCDVSKNPLITPVDFFCSDNPNEPGPASQCTQDSDCNGNRFCLDSIQGSVTEPCSSDSKNCFCFTNIYPTPCNDSSGCDVFFEGCLRYGAEGGSFCGNCDLSNMAHVEPVDSVCNLKEENEDSSPQSNDSSANFEKCSNNSDCKGSRECVQADHPVFDPPFLSCNRSEGKHECHCVARSNISCKRSRDCLDGDRCFFARKNSSKEMKCVSCEGSVPLEGAGFILEAVDNGDGRCATCIGANMLTAFKKGELLYERNRRAQVLCDSYGSCATEGHIVVFRGIPMMMSSYCVLPEVSCSRREMMVNSPRLQVGLRVMSRSNDLEFTAFSAQYGTVLEESFLRSLIRVGLWTLRVSILLHYALQKKFILP